MIKNVKLRAFEIQNEKLGESLSGLSKKLEERLMLSSTANERRMKVEVEGEDGVEDLISSYRFSESVDFLTILRISPEKDVQHIDDFLFNKRTFSIDELGCATIETSAIYKSHYYVGISGDFLVTNLPGNITISRLQNYLNWYLGEKFEISPVVDLSSIRNFRDVKSIVFSDPIGKSTESIASAQRSMFDLPQVALDSLVKIFKDIKDVNGLDLENVISAKLIINIAKPNKENSKALERVYSAMLKPVSDLDHVQIQTRDGRRAKKGSDILRIKSFAVKKSDSGDLDEVDLIRVMSEFLRDLRR